MDDKAIAIIITNTSREYINYMKSKVQELYLPKDFEIDLIVSEYKGSLVESFQFGQDYSSAKYKIYIPPKSDILNKYFLRDVIRIFNSNKNVGVIGVVGGEKLSTTGRLELSANLFGNILLKSGEKTNLLMPDFFYREVCFLSDDFLATQYDIKWRMDLLHGDNCWGISQTQEFRRKGFFAVVPHQYSPWIMRTEEHVASNDELNAILDEYSKDLYPLVSVIIPSYYPDFLVYSLDSVVNQSYRNLDIFISDDSDDDKINYLIKKYSNDSRIKFVRHNRFNSFENGSYCFHYNNANAEYVKWMMDDDILALDCIARQVEYFQYFPDVTLVTSARKRIDENNNLLPDIPLTERIVDKTTRFSGEVIADAMLMNLANSIGEPTTALCRKNAMYAGYKLGYNGECPDHYFMSDIMTWLYLLTQGDLIYIAETLSYYRVHGRQESQGEAGRFASLIAWIRCIKWARKSDKFLKNKSHFRRSLEMWCKIVEYNLRDSDKELNKSKYRKDLIAVFYVVKEALDNEIDEIEFEHLLKHQFNDL